MISQPDCKSPARNVLISCVVDDAPKFHVQAWLWLDALAGLINQKHTGLRLHYCGNVPAALAQKAQDVGAKMIEVAPFGPGPAAYCNKLQQLEGMIAENPRHVILCDTDLAFLTSPEPLCLAGVVRAKPVDKPNPPRDMIVALFDKANLPPPDLSTPVDFETDALTHAFNCNGGLYVISGTFLAELAARWRHWSTFCLNSPEILGSRLLHADQLGFMFAMDELDLPFSPLETRHNYPLHFPADTYETMPTCSPEIMHYHWQLSPTGEIIAPNTPGLLQQAELFNARSEQSRRSPEFQSLLRAWHSQIQKESTQ